MHIDGLSGRFGATVLYSRVLTYFPPLNDLIDPPWTIGFSFFSFFFRRNVHYRFISPIKVKRNCIVVILRICAFAGACDQRTLAVSREPRNHHHPHGASIVYNSNPQSKLVPGVAARKEGDGREDPGPNTNEQPYFCDVPGFLVIVTASIGASALEFSTTWGADRVGERLDGCTTNLKPTPMIKNHNRCKQMHPKFPLTSDAAGRMDREINIEPILALERRIEDHEDERAVVHLKRAPNSLLNISSLPPETLGDIFRWNVIPKSIFDGPERGSYNFLLVCHRWFEVASHTPGLWSCWGNNLQDWKKRCLHHPAVPLDLVLDGTEFTGRFVDSTLRSALQDRAARDTVRRVHLGVQNSDLLTSVLSLLTSDREKNQPSSLESLILWTEDRIQ